MDTEIIVRPKLMCSDVIRKDTKENGEKIIPENVKIEQTRCAEP